MKLPHIVVVLLDCLRVDAITIAIMPNLRRLLDTSHYYSNVEVKYAHTSMSVPELFFGDVGVPPVRPDQFIGRPSLPRMWQRTHTTAAFIGTPIFNPNNMHPPLRWLFSDFDSVFFEKHPMVKIHEPLRQAQRFMDKQRSPCFIYVHHHGAHGPYRGGSSSMDAGEVASKYGGPHIPKNVASELRENYFRGCRILDKELPDLLTPFSRPGVLLALLTDHGEMLGEGGVWGHGYGGSYDWSLARQTFFSFIHSSQKANQITRKVRQGDFQKLLQEYVLHRWVKDIRQDASNPQLEALGYM